MPIYEYLCHDCNRIYSFLSQSYDEQRQPDCPKCEASGLTKQISSFAFKRSRPNDPGLAMGQDQGEGGFGGSGPDDLDPRTEREMMKLMSDAEHMDENDPKQLGHLMRRMGEITGESLDPAMEEAVRRLESGEDPDRIEEDLGEALDEGLDGMDGMPGMGPMGAPSRDDGLYSF